MFFARTSVRSIGKGASKKLNTAIHSSSIYV